MATKKRTTTGGNDAAHDDVVLKELRLIHEEIRTQGTRLDGRIDGLSAEVHSQGTRLDGLSAEVRSQGTRLDALTAEVRAQGTELRAQGTEQRAQGTELRAVRDLLVAATASDRRRIDLLETRVSALEAGKH
ncbi:MAG: hypothetical protein A2138_27715 [Deltaproteobacteria bacterium RBG_16_71_12]|nr:MAG: hypothetical protein A2138_27715 [Deltaproteobacteria bacterium RBG_16_71_12]